MVSIGTSDLINVIFVLILKIYPFSTCVMADEAPFKISVSEADDLVKKCPECGPGTLLESEGNTFFVIFLRKEIICIFTFGQLTNGITCIS